MEVTLEDFLRDNPGKTEEDFAELKALLDEIYYQQDRQEQRTSRHDVSINGMEEMDIAAVPPIDAELIRKSEEEKALVTNYLKYKNLFNKIPHIAISSKRLSYWATRTYPSLLYFSSPLTSGNYGNCRTTQGKCLRKKWTSLKNSYMR